MLLLRIRACALEPLEIILENEIKSVCLPFQPAPLLQTFFIPPFPCYFQPAVVPKFLFSSYLVFNFTNRTMMVTILLLLVFKTY